MPELVKPDNITKTENQNNNFELLAQYATSKCEIY